MNTSVAQECLQETLDSLRRARQRYEVRRDDLLAEAKAVNQAVLEVLEEECAIERARLLLQIEELG